MSVSGRFARQVLNKESDMSDSKEVRSTAMALLNVIIIIGTEEWDVV